MDVKILILLVEDEEPIQELLKDALEDAGFAVLSATSGEEAIKVLDLKGEYFRALVTDINLGPSPIAGWEVAERARQRSHRLPVLYITGGSAHEWEAKGVPNSLLLTKPFTAARLVAALSQLVENTPGA